mmetsp:Transcript_30116/g.54576  ORF Transcript_30116/g.54576 Transcript_30116/m.54576 type:complete len:438 (-) Transcript_30116:51-1364(-)|eukprot:CAMPEP_0201895626 /NCGR_PEP_ID=MMETSP0902-20130614/43037_1 /ASSEMBLY_ACC=CAM_ASM_000551 /TAXON_ID=420261 /ORGANISM="Thalassiosira antarctica, Strain CCMP982" /LENGTH=437 /DNA_ID=CAMNT_0048428011 /DNA_START=34 /DNA_END=1347 /DNA_ORIENTATION=-
MTRSSRRNYNRISANQGDDTADNVTESNALDEPLAPSFSSLGDDDDGDDTPIKDGEKPLVTQSSTTASLALIPPIYHEINVVLMDAAQSKFNIKCDAQWKVSEFKEVSASVTKVPPQAQRLIHMGKLLQDESTLGDFGINENGKIIHLFPKPNVVINTSSSSDGDGNQTNNTNDDGEEGASEGGAHVPQIILDAEEASRRSQILILSSQEIFEAQHRVKIFSFLLMIISSMELLTLMTLFVGVQAEDPTGYGGGSAGGAPPGNPTDAPPSEASNASLQMRTWQNSDYFDTVISAFGFYVSLLGIKATTENTLQLAKRYFLCLVVAGIGYNCYYYYTNVQQEEKHALERSQQIGPSELYTTAFFGILLPLTVWLLCIIRAYQFQSLIREAEVEAEERTRGQTEQGASDSSSGEGGETPRTLPYGSDDLELSVERGVSS